MDKKSYKPVPYQVIVLHGGPGGVGDVSALVEFIANFELGLEPPMVEKTIEDQLNNLGSHIRSPVTIIGYSWGAMMAVLCANRFSDLVKNNFNWLYSSRYR